MGTKLIFIGLRLPYLLYTFLMRSLQLSPSLDGTNGSSINNAANRDYFFVFVLGNINSLTQSSDK